MAMRMTLQTQLILRAMLDNPQDMHYGLELAERAGLKSGTLYPILTRLERNGLVESSWEDVDPSVAGRPARRYYRLTAEGLHTAATVLSESVARLSPDAKTLPLH